jgi:tRNA threonylcarbamoyladenosine biosynthesis protein TsaB
MIILTIRTDKPEAEIGLFEHTTELAYVTWEAHRQLAETIHTKLEAMLQSQQKDWSNIKGIVCFKGPGSFTGLRIGLTVGNALAYGLGCSIVATQGDDWIKTGLTKIGAGESEPFVVPEYGSPAHITKPKH